MDPISKSEKLLILWTLIEIFTTKNLRGFRQDLTMGEKKIYNYCISLGAKGRLEETGAKRNNPHKHRHAKLL